MKNKRVLYLTNIPSPYRVEFFNELTKYMDVTVAFELRNAKNRDEAWQSGENYKFKSVFMKPLITRTESAYCPEVFKLLKEFKNDVIVVGGYATPTGMAAILYLKAKKIPFYLNCDGGFIGDDSLFKKKVKTFFIGSATYYLSTGVGADKYLMHYGAKKERIYHYSFSSLREEDIEEAVKKRDEKVSLRNKIGLAEKNMIVFVGSFIHRKGIDILLKACTNMEDTAVVLVGGSDISAYKDMVSEKLKEHIYPVGFKNKEEMKKYYQAADLMVLPTREDIWGLVINEAMAQGLPVVTTDRCLAGLTLVKNGENGYTVPVEGVEALKQAIEKVFEGDNASEFGRKSLEKIRNYTIERMAAEHRDIFKAGAVADKSHKVE